MVCTEDICALYSEMSGADRIDAMCALLMRSHPLERRFLGSVLESLCRIDYRRLVPEEQKANHAEELSKIHFDVYNPSIRSKLIVFLSLLHSSNTLCSNLIFELLCTVRRYIEDSKNTCNDTVVEDLILLLTMSIHHPAFTYCQRVQLFEFLSHMKKYCNNDFEQSPGEIGDNSLQLDSCSENSCSPNSRCSLSTTDNSPPVHVITLELQKRYHDTDDKNTKSPVKNNKEFHVHVVWSNGFENDVVKTYPEFFSFHSELIKLFPKDAGAHKQERHIPFLPQEKNSRDLSEPMRQYVRQLTTLPDRIQHCSLFYQFFSGGENTMNIKPAPQGPDRKQASLPEKRHEDNPQNGAPILNGMNDSDSASSCAATMNCTPRRQPCHSLSLPDVSFNRQRSSSPPVQFSVSTTATTARPTYIPLIHPAQAGNYRLGESPTVSDWLKTARLHKYSNKLGKFSFIELLNLTDDRLEAFGLTQGAQKRFHEHIDELRAFVQSSQYYPPPNGLTSYTCPSSITEFYIYPGCQPPFQVISTNESRPQPHPSPKVSSDSSDGVVEREEVERPNQSVSAPVLQPSPRAKPLESFSDSDLRPIQKVDKSTDPKGSSRGKRETRLDEQGPVVVSARPHKPASSYVHRQPRNPQYPIPVYSTPYPLSPTRRPNSLEVSGWSKPPLGAQTEILVNSCRQTPATTPVSTIVPPLPAPQTPVSTPSSNPIPAPEACKECGVTGCIGHCRIQFIPPPALFTHAFLPQGPANGVLSPPFPPPAHMSPLNNPNFPANGISPALMAPAELYPVARGSGGLANPGHMTPYTMYLPFVPQFNFYYSTSNSNNYMKRNKHVTCYNCGLLGHIAKECSNPSMEATNTSATYQLDMKPKDLKSS